MAGRRQRWCEDDLHERFRREDLLNDNSKRCRRLSGIEARESRDDGLGCCAGVDCDGCGHRNVPSLNRQLVVRRDNIHARHCSSQVALVGILIEFGDIAGDDRLVIDRMFQGGSRRSWWRRARLVRRDARSYVLAIYMWLQRQEQKGDRARTHHHAPNPVWRVPGARGCVCACVCASTCVAVVGCVAVCVRACVDLCGGAAGVCGRWCACERSRIWRYACVCG